MITKIYLKPVAPLGTHFSKCRTKLINSALGNGLNYHYSNLFYRMVLQHIVQNVEQGTGKDYPEHHPIEFIDHSQFDLKAWSTIGARFYDEAAAKKYLKTLVALEKLIRPQMRLALTGDPQDFLEKRFNALEDLLQTTGKVLHDNKKISDDFANRLSGLVEIASDFDVVRRTGGLDEKCLKDMLTILRK